jgi:hypothetical protein
LAPLGGNPRDDRTARWTMYQDRAEALKAVGLEEQALSANAALVQKG